MNTTKQTSPLENPDIIDEYNRLFNDPRNCNKDVGLIFDMAVANANNKTS